MKRATALLAACALVLPSSGWGESQGRASNCKGENNCDITVIVPATCGSGIHVAPDPLVVEPGATLTWTLRSSGKYVFSGDGIKIDAPDKAFEKPKVSNENKTVKLKRLTTEKGMFKYDIILKGPDGTCRHDPTIINQ